MAGKNCTGSPTTNPTTRNASAYCAGRAAAAGGVLLAANPHDNGPDQVNWAAGHASWSADPAGLPAGDCCADVPGGGHVP